jgi:hypothetical protein
MHLLTPPNSQQHPTTMMIHPSESNEINSNAGEYPPSRRLKQRITRAANIQHTRNPAKFNKNRTPYGEDTAHFISCAEHRYAQLTATDNTTAPENNKEQKVWYDTADEPSP